MAKDFGRIYNTSLIRDKVEYGTCIYKVNGKYAFTVPTVGEVYGIDFVKIQKPKGTVALIDTHGNYTVGLNGDPYCDRFSKNAGDYDVAKKFKMPLYLVTPGGTLQSYSFGKWLKGGKPIPISKDMPKDPNAF